jgi:hypothetical protein
LDYFPRFVGGAVVNKNYFRVFRNKLSATGATGAELFYFFPQPVCRFGQRGFFIIAWNNNINRRGGGGRFTGISFIAHPIF